MTSESDALYKSESRNGLGVFAKKIFLKEEFILKFDGPLLDYDAVNGENTNSYHAHYCIQIDKRSYIGAGWGIDDYVNHSCDPNSGIKKIADNFILIALRDIILGEEITFDYSTYMDENNWEMDCNCGSQNCRGRIRDFKYLSKDMQHHYRLLGIVGDFIN